MSFPTYPCHKDSGVDWLGEIPEGWSIKPLWTLFRRHKLTGFPDEQLLSVYRDYGVIPKASRDDNFNKPSDDLGAYQLVQVGDLAINKMKAWQGSVGISSYRGIVSPAYHVYAPSHSECPQYLHHLFRCNEYILGYLANSKGIRVNQWDLEPQQHSRMPVLLPSFQEQAQIARFLDHETARIDALIEEQQRLIELLKEKRQAVISHAVTKGLDPTVPMKNSGEEWLGEVPAHWDVARVKNVAKLESGHTPSKDFPEYWEGGEIPWVSLNDSKQLKVTDYIEETQFMITELGVSNSSARLLPARAVVFTRDATIGLAAITTKPMCVSQHLIAWICNENLVLPEYLLLVFYAMEEELDRFTFGATIKTIGMPDIRKLVTPVPPLAEQAQVVAGVNAKRELIDQLIKESNTALSLHLERRSALISAAVTGKIDVRGWEPPASTQAPKLEVAEAN